MPYFAAAVVHGADGWSASEFSLNGTADIEDVADRLRDVDPEADVSLLFVESDDTYLVILRLDQSEDLRIFGSDVAFAEESRLGRLLLGEIEKPVLELVEPVVATVGAGGDGAGEVTGRGVPPPQDVDPVGDMDLLVDLGVSASQLLELCAHDGMLPSDVTAEVCQAIGCGDEVEELREA